MNWDPSKMSKCGKKLKYRTKRNMFVFRVQQTAMVCEHTMEQQWHLRGQACLGEVIVQWTMSKCQQKTEIWNKISPRLRFLTTDEVDFIHLKQGQYSIVY